MLRGYGFVAQALLGTLFTWGVTALGAALVFVLDSSNVDRNQKMLDSMLGFAAGVMLAASYWSLLAPAIEASELTWGKELSFVPAAVGFAAGGAAMMLVDQLLPWLGLGSADGADALISMATTDDDDAQAEEEGGDGKEEDGGSDGGVPLAKRTPRSSDAGGGLRRRGGGGSASKSPAPSAAGKKKAAAAKNNATAKTSAAAKKKAAGWRRTMLLVIAVTVHNFPEGLAVGVAFGGQDPALEGLNATAAAAMLPNKAEGGFSTFASARNIAVGIGLQNFPEGLAVSMPLRRQGLSLGRCFWYGQLSGMVEPLGGLLGAWAVRAVEPLLPYALSFAAGAMIFVVVDELVPEAAESGNKRLSTVGAMLGFILMMSMDVGLG